MIYSLLRIIDIFIIINDYREAIDYIYFLKSLDTDIRLALLIIIKLFFVLSAVFLTATFAPAASGSGIPELKAILSGIWIRRM